MRVEKKVNSKGVTYYLIMDDKGYINGIDYNLKDATNAIKAIAANITHKGNTLRLKKVGY